MRTRWPACAFSHVAFVSRSFASPGLMSYVSKSKWTSARSGIAMNSDGEGRASDRGVAVVGPAAERAPPPVPDAGTIVELLLPVGAGADVASAAGCFAQPATHT